jgi:hypothetical protein
VSETFAAVGKLYDVDIIRLGKVLDILGIEFSEKSFHFITYGSKK